MSAVSVANQNAYEVTGGYTTYGIEYMPGDDGYITWFSDGKPTWTVLPSAIGPFHPSHPLLDFQATKPDLCPGSDPLVNISAREISPEPMYLLMNLGYSNGFGEVRRLVTAFTIDSRKLT